MRRTLLRVFDGENIEATIHVSDFRGHWSVWIEPFFQKKKKNNNKFFFGVKSNGSPQYVTQENKMTLPASNCICTIFLAFSHQILELLYVLSLRQNRRSLNPVLDAGIQSLSIGLYFVLIHTMIGAFARGFSFICEYKYRGSSIL